MRRASAVLLTVLMVGAGCHSDASAPDTPADPVSGVAFGRADGSVTVPMQGRATLFWIVDQGPQALAACNPRPGLAVGSGEGEATHMGRFRVVEANHCSIDLAVVPPLIDGIGPFEWMAADGATISGHYEFLLLPPADGGYFTMHVEGGTGRFEGATGRLDFVPERSGLLECADPLCLNGATVEAFLRGAISIPRP